MINSNRKRVGNCDFVYNQMMDEDDELMTGDSLADKRVDLLVGSVRKRSLNEFEEDLLQKDVRARGWEVNHRRSEDQIELS